MVASCCFFAVFLTYYTYLLVRHTATGNFPVKASKGLTRLAIGQIVSCEQTSPANFVPNFLSFNFKSVRRLRPTSDNLSINLYFHSSINIFTVGLTRE